MRTTSLLTVAALVNVAASAHANDCRYSAERSASAPTAGIERIRVEAGAGTLRIDGKEGVAEVSVRGLACSDDESLVAATDVEIRREGTLLIVSTVLPEPRERQGWFSDTVYATLDLKVDLPRGAALEVEDSSGDLDVRDVGPLELADSSGGIRIRDVSGPLKVSDSSGAIEIRNVDGDLELTDSSGDVDVQHVAGNVIIPVDSSGDLEIRDVQGSVHILTDTSGDITLADVRDDVRIEVDSSGSIRVDRVGGSFTVESDASGTIRHDQVAGAVSLPGNR